MRHLRIAKIFFGFLFALLISTTPAVSAERADVFFPAQGLICDRIGGYCLNYKGFSVAHTQTYLGEKAADRLATQLLVLSSHHIDTATMVVTFSNRIHCDLQSRVCKKNLYADAVDKTYTQALVPVKTQRISQRIAPNTTSAYPAPYTSDQGLMLSFASMDPGIVSAELRLAKQTIWFASGMQAAMYVNLDDFEALQSVKLQVMDARGKVEIKEFSSGPQMLGRLNTDAALQTPNALFSVPVTTRLGDVIVTMQAAKVPRNFSFSK